MPAALLGLGAVTGGWALWLALLWMTGLAVALDRLMPAAGPEAAGGAEFPAGDRLSVALGVLHFPVLALGVLAVSGATGLSGGERIVVFLAFGLFLGQVVNANAHELIHRTDPALARLGKWVFVSLAYGHHVTAHPRIHHRYVGTAEDPATAELGESFWSYLPRAWWGAFRSGFEIESAIAAVKGRRLRPWQHPYAEYLAGSAGTAAIAALISGWGGVLAWILLCAHAQLQILLSDYVQHYGLRRATGPDGRPEPVAPWHSWNAPHWFSAGLMLNAPRHSDHHVHPVRPFPALELPDAGDAPRLPHALPVMGAIALIPPLWHRMMDRRAQAWQARIDSGALARAAVVARAEAARKARRAGEGRRSGGAGAGRKSAAVGAAGSGAADAAGTAALASPRTGPGAAPADTAPGRDPVAKDAPALPAAPPAREAAPDPETARLRAALAGVIAAAAEEAAPPETVSPAPERPARERLLERPEPAPLRADDPIAAAVARAMATEGVLDARRERVRRAALLPPLAPPDPGPRWSRLVARAAAAARALGLRALPPAL